MRLSTATSQESDKVPQKIGLIATQGDFPLLIARAAKACGTEVVAICINGFANPEMEETAARFHWLELGQIGRAIEILQAEEIHHLTMAGRVPHNNIFQYRHFDWRAMKIMARAASKRADDLLSSVCNEFLSEGIEVIDSSMFLKSLMPASGLLTQNRPLTSDEWDSVHFGLPIAKASAAQDIGQTIIVKDLLVIAVEALEGTDKCILRAGELAGAGCVVIKVSKPNQDLRFDIPVIGPGTIKSMVAAKASALVLTSGRSLIFHREKVIQEAELNGIGIHIVDDEIIDNRIDSK